MISVYLAAGAAALALLATPALAQDHSDHAGHGSPAAPAPAPTPHHHSTTAADDDHAGHDISLTTNYPFSADGSGTSRLPGREGGHSGLHLTLGNDTMAMVHGYATLVHTNQSGPRGGDKTYVQSMLMASAERNTGWGRIQLKSMLSLEPLMSNRGYPSLFATGETAAGEPLVDAQHPHDLFMELAARVDVNITDNASLFLYGGPVGEPAIGPSAFMHRASSRYNSEAPITHHWFDSTHITYGVVTAGYASRHFQLEASAFRGEEPDEDRWDIETPRLDSWSLRATWTPSPRWALQVSHGRLEQPEAQHPGENEARTTASAHYSDGSFSATAAFSNKKRLPGGTLTAWLAEMNWDIDDRHTFFGRVENVANDELFPDHDDPLHDQRFRVSKAQIGYAYRVPLGSDFNLALGGTVSVFAKPDALDAAYGDNPTGFTLFARVSLGR